jgi:lipopolysaccharide transport system permease protein
VVPVVLQLGFWFTPIVYTTSVVPEALRPIVAANPMTTIVHGYQNAMLFDKPPDMLALGWLVLVALLLLLGSLIVFRRASPEMVDVL